METQRSREEQQQLRNLDVESLAKLVFRLLKQRLREQGTLPDYSWTSLGLRETLFPDADPRQSAFDRVKLLDAIGLLERKGLVMKDDSYSWMRNREIAEFGVHLTSNGMKSDFDDEILLLVDKPQEIIDALEQDIGTLDNVVRQYFLESLRAYQVELHIAFVLCLGVASERAVDWLAESLKEICSETHHQNLEKKMKGNISGLTKYLSDTIVPSVFNENDTFAKELKKQLDWLARIYRENRNEAGHPKNVVQNWSRENQHVLLSQFPRYITTICKAIRQCCAKSESTADGH